MPLTQTVNLAAQNVGPTLSSRIANGETTLKPTPGRVDYYFSNYCAPCELKLSKEHLRCPECKQKVRTRAWHRSKIIKYYEKI